MFNVFNVNNVQFSDMGTVYLLYLMNFPFFSHPISKKVSVNHQYFILCLSCGNPEGIFSCSKELELRVVFVLFTCFSSEFLCSGGMCDCLNGLSLQITLHVIAWCLAAWFWLLMNHTHSLHGRRPYRIPSHLWNHSVVQSFNQICCLSGKKYIMI